MKGFNIDAISTENKETGVWAPFEGGKFLIAHSSNTVFQRALARRQAPYRQQIDDGKLDPDTSATIFCGALAEGVLLNWSDVYDGKGVEVKYSPELAAKLLRTHDDLRVFVQRFSMDLSNYRREVIESEGNV